MSSDVPRRAVPPGQLSAASIPPAPPLPPQRTPQPSQPTTARSAFARFVTQPFTAYGSRPATAHTNRADAGRLPALFTPKLLGSVLCPASNGLVSPSSHTGGVDVHFLGIACAAA